MEIISYSEAAIEAGVSRQCICNMRIANKNGIRNWSFFIFDPESGKPGVDRSNKDWERYVNKNTLKRVNKNSIKDNPNGNQRAVNDKIASLFIKLLEIISYSIVEVLHPSELELDKIRKLSIEKYKRSLHGSR